MYEKKMLPSRELIINTVFLAYIGYVKHILSDYYVVIYFDLHVTQHRRALSLQFLRKSILSVSKY